jgi:hypothetical protein
MDFTPHLSIGSRSSALRELGPLEMSTVPPLGDAL